MRTLCQIIYHVVDNIFRVAYSYSEITAQFFEGFAEISARKNDA